MTSSKKAWVTPSVESLDVQDTLGGIVQTFTERQPFTVNINNIPTPTFGTIPAPQQ